MSTHNTDKETIRKTICEWLKKTDHEIELWVQHVIEQVNTEQNESK